MRSVGGLKGEATSDGKLIQLVWKDQNVALFMSTVNRGIGKITIERPCRRLAPTSTNARSSRRVFGDQAVKRLPIPASIDCDNHFMNAVD